MIELLILITLFIICMTMLVVYKAYKPALILTLIYFSVMTLGIIVISDCEASGRQYSDFQCRDRVLFPAPHNQARSALISDPDELISVIKSIEFALEK